ncbi:hypothetical protein AB0D35_26855 [Streptomyces sp. NPDC048301]|uniref:hypothetical protein n=1 Tax=Streptomyces sp. NPDC048301 TaxID=3155631 RepID=UPI003445C2AA
MKLTKKLAATLFASAGLASALVPLTASSASAASQYGCSYPRVCVYGGSYSGGSIIAEAVFARSVSGHADPRKASRRLAGPSARRLCKDEAARGRVRGLVPGGTVSSSGPVARRIRGLATPGRRLPCPVPGGSTASEPGFAFARPARSGVRPGLPCG